MEMDACLAGKERMAFQRLGKNSPPTLLSPFLGVRYWDLVAVLGAMPSSVPRLHSWHYWDRLPAGQGLGCVPFLWVQDLNMFWSAECPSQISWVTTALKKKKKVLFVFWGVG